MAIKTYRPITPTLRFKSSQVNDDLTTNRPHKPLTETKKRTGGRRNSGDLTIWHRGGGHKRKIRVIDFKRDKTGIPATVATIEYDPNRSARIALLHYADGEKRYILQPVGLQVGAKIVSGPEADILVGNALPLKNIPAGRRSWWPRKANTPCSSCPRARPAGCWWTAWPPWARWAIPTTKTFRWARPGALAGSASSRRTAAW